MRGCGVSGCMSVVSQVKAVLL
ncbi:hypothetical protein QTP86_005097 [Hemibagrus guttatus]|nr:hypothetical protein QTP86_005097 [Hemibagrus guttatus]